MPARRLKEPKGVFFLFRGKWLWGLLLFVLPFLLYLNSFQNDFLSGDDEEIILRNLYLRDWRYLPQLFTENYKAGSGTLSNFWRPFQVLTYSFIVHTAGIKLLPFHLSSILFHSLCGLCLFLIFCRIFVKKVSAGIIALVTALWLAHPLHNEELAVTSGIASPSYLCWMLFGILFFMLFEEKRHWYYLALSLIGYILSLCSKESAIIFPALVLGLHLAGIKAGLFKKTGVRILILKHSLFWVAAFSYLTLRLTKLNFQNTLNFYGEANLFTQNLSYRIFTLWTILVHGLRVIFWPQGLHPERSWPVFISFFNPQVWGAFLLLAVIIIFALRSWKKQPWISFGVFWFFSSYLPMSNLVAKINALVWDHWFYAPSAGIGFILLSLLAYGSPKLKKSLFYFFIPCLVILSIMTVLRNRYWQDTEAASRLILSYEPDSAKTWNNLAIALAERGKIGEAADCYLRAIALADIYPQTHHNLANLYIGLGKYDLAETEYLKAIKLDPDFYYSYLGLGKLYFLKGQPQQAGEYFRQALEIYPHLPEAEELLRRLSQQSAQ
jgi:tetratricopeptide (TPR) repeat protein